MYNQGKVFQLSSAPLLSWCLDISIHTQVYLCHQFNKMPLCTHIKGSTQACAISETSSHQVWLFEVDFLTQKRWDFFKKMINSFYAQGKAWCFIASFLNFYVYVFTSVCMCVDRCAPCRVLGGIRRQSTGFGFLVPRISSGFELRSSGLVEQVFTYWAISLTPLFL